MVSVQYKSSACLLSPMNAQCGHPDCFNDNPQSCHNRYNEE